MYIDWVRIYQRGDEGQSFDSNVPSEEIETAPTAVESVRNDASAVKLLRDGQLLIRRGATLYDLQGNRIE